MCWVVWGRSKRFAALLNAARRPFHVINYLGSWAGGQLVPPATMVKLMRRTLRALQRRLGRETEETLALTMHFPTAWDPYFRQQMTVQDVYHYGPSTMTTTGANSLSTSSPWARTRGRSTRNGWRCW